MTLQEKKDHVRMCCKKNKGKGYVIRISGDDKQGVLEWNVALDELIKEGVYTR